MSLISPIEANYTQNLDFQQFLRGRWFSSLPHALARALFLAGRVVECRAGHSLFLEGAPPQGLYGLIQGAVHFETIDHSGRRVLFHVAGAGYWFGAISLTAQKPMMMSARAFGRVKVLHIPVFKIPNALLHTPEGARALCTLVEMRLSTLLNFVTGMRRPTAIAQVGSRLAALDRNAKENDSSLRLSVLHMTQSDLADMTGHSRQTINAIVARFQQCGFIKVARRQIVITNAAALERYCWADLNA
jgi:CRP/FNR family cyclic AMP-dependent transcriptional regulator